MKTQNIDVPKEAIAHFCQHWHITKLSLFGFVLRDDFRPDSDIDVLGGVLKPHDRMGIAVLRDN